jgi:hypothetical protein
MANNLTIFQKLANAFRGDNKDRVSSDIITTPYSHHNLSNEVLFTTTDKDEYERKLKSYQQQKFLTHRWQKASADNAMESLAGYTAVKLMYRDVDLMDGTPEIGTALDIISEESCPITSKGKMINVYSSSKRTKSILEDLFINRLHIYTDLPMIARHLVKYGNTYMLLNINKDNGIMGWTMLPVYEMDRIENGHLSSYGVSINNNNNTTNIKKNEVRFVWTGHNEAQPYFNWEIAHFRLLNDSFFLPYGVSMLHKARRAWRMWSMMEDAMLIWRLDKAIERRVYKIYVGNINDEDVPAYVNEIANNFKRTQIIDPATGQIDLRKNFLDVSSDYFIPVRREDAPTPIDTLSAANSQVQMEDVEYMQNKMFAAMRVPKTFLNFQEAQGKGQNLSIMDIRFSRMINRIQQFLLMELNKIAMMHLYLMGLHDEIGNFTITLNNPSSQIEALELEELTKRLTAMQTALSDPGTGIPMMSMHKALREIMKMSDSEIKDMLNEIRIEKAMAAELETTANIIKKTGIFDTVDRIYGDYEAMNNPQQPQNNNEEGGFGEMGGGGIAPGGFGDEMDMDLGEPGSSDEGDLSGETGETDMGNAPDADAGNPLMENSYPRRHKLKSFLNEYLDNLSKNNEEIQISEDTKKFNHQITNINEAISGISKQIDTLVNIEEFEKEKILTEAIENTDFE